MAAMPTLAIGIDGEWRARMRCLLASRREVKWLGAYAPAQSRIGSCERPALLLLDGDDPRRERERRDPRLPAPHRLYFYRQPDLAALHHCVAIRANACLDKATTSDLLRKALPAAGSGLFVVAPVLLLHALETTVSEWEGQAAMTLTRRQREIMHWAAQGMSNKQIARQLGISPETVKSHLQEAFQRRGVNGRMALLAAMHNDNGGSEPRLH
ncbi:MAG TPA: LuxR C-terminal-related transcriptional regulator [Lysobacter sp.]|nr:LuxR C-terminal-related transcriptional regulator [Lysobacter sp.]